MNFGPWMTGWKGLALLGIVGGALWFWWPARVPAPDILTSCETQARRQGLAPVSPEPEVMPDVVPAGYASTLKIDGRPVTSSAVLTLSDGSVWQCRVDARGRVTLAPPP